LRVTIVRFTVVMVVLCNVVSCAPSSARPTEPATIPAQVQRPASIRTENPKHGATISGRVLLDGKPVRYFGVTVTPNWAMESRKPPTVVRARDGRFSISNIEPGHWDVIVAGPGFARYLALGHDLDDDAHAIDLGDLNVKHGFTIEGHVTTADGRPAAGATVSLNQSPVVDSRDRDELTALTRGNLTTVTDNDGAYFFEGVTTIDLAGSGPRISASLPDGRWSLASDLSSGNAKVDLVITAVGEVDGTVSGTIDPKGLVFARSATKSRTFYDTKLRRDGSFVFPNLPIGEYQLFVFSPSAARPGAPVRVTVVADQPTSVALTAP
jgi:Protein of unknown function (DUF2012)